MGIFDKLFKKKNDETDEKLQELEEQIEQVQQDIDVEEEMEQLEVEIDTLETLEKEKAEIEDLKEIEESEDALEIGVEDENNLSEPEIKTKKGFFSKLKEGLDKTRQNIMTGVDNVLSSFTKIDEDLFEELEEALIMSDIGVETTTKIIDGLRERVKRARATDASQVKQLLIEEITQILEQDETKLTLKSPAVILVIGVNGVGKTTTIGKLASIYKQQGNKVLLAAADTFRAAAIDQLEVWGQRSNIEVIKHQENSDPAAVVYDAVQAAKARHTDVLICDTAGRLHNKKNLMDELKKIFKVISREYPEAQKEVFLVLDGTTGQNALQQAKVFKEVADITGIVLTKLDGTAKGGIVIAIKSELNIPVRYIGVGEGINDLQEFNAADFAKALFNE
jgi:fused signal recognition particle receptor